MAADDHAQDGHAQDDHAKDGREPPASERPIEASPDAAGMPMSDLLAGLRAVAEPTRLRLLALSAHGELTVSELTHILGQSQPRVSRHLKLLCDAGLLERLPEGNWAYYRLARDGPSGRLVEAIVDLIGEGDRQLALDLERLDAVKRARAEEAAAYFSRNAWRWNEIRSLHVDEREVEQTLLSLFPEGPIGELVDIGTGTGRMLELFASRIRRGIGIDLSREMLSVARSSVDRPGMKNCQVRQGDMYQLPFASGQVDAAIMHLVLHYAERPGQAIAEAARILKPGGRLVIVDFAPHERTELQREHAHRWLGFEDSTVLAWLAEAGLAPAEPVHLAGAPLTVALWSADRPAAG